MGQTAKRGMPWWRSSLLVLGISGISIVVLCTTAGCGPPIFWDPSATPWPVAEPVRVPPAVPTVAVKDLRLSLEDYPRVDGSTSAQPLAVLVACKALGVPHRWGTKLDGSRWMEPYTTALPTRSITTRSRWRPRPMSNSAP